MKMKNQKHAISRQEHGFARMVRIGTDKNPWASVESVSSVFSFAVLHFSYQVTEKKVQISVLSVCPPVVDILVCYSQKLCCMGSYRAPEQLKIFSPEFVRVRIEFVVYLNSFNFPPYISKNRYRLDSF